MESGRFFFFVAHMEMSKLAQTLSIMTCDQYFKNIIPFIRCIPCPSLSIPVSLLTFASEDEVRDPYQQMNDIIYTNLLSFSIHHSYRIPQPLMKEDESSYMNIATL